VLLGLDILAVFETFQKLLTFCLQVSRMWDKVISWQAINMCDKAIL